MAPLLGILMVVVGMTLESLKGASQGSVPDAIRALATRKNKSRFADGLESTAGDLVTPRKT